MNKKFIVLKVANRLEKIVIDSILYIRVEDNYCRVNTSRDIYTTRQSLRKLLSILPGNIFSQVHRSYVVNMSRISGLSSGAVFIENHRIPLGRFPKNKLYKNFFNNA